jgi:hypothetical protein
VPPMHRKHTRRRNYFLTGDVPMLWEFGNRPFGDLKASETDRHQVFTILRSHGPSRRIAESSEPESARLANNFRQSIVSPARRDDSSFSQSMSRRNGSNSGPF